MFAVKKFFNIPSSPKKQRRKQDSISVQNKLPQPDIDTFFATIRSPADFQKDERMADLANVGIKKALGYLPLQKICEAGYDLFSIATFLKKRALSVFIIPNPLPEEIYAYNPVLDKFIHITTRKMYEVIPKGGFLSIKSGALVAFDKKAIDVFLEDNVELIIQLNEQESNEANRWPMESAEFVNMLFRKNANSAQMSHLIHCIYTSMPNYPLSSSGMSNNS
ncbi:hypothetical protein [Legionella hackeliae]|uniref:Uncharacterized protein n=1 Tax=Legionella hackeliae TaxID=449 RepID=A0A0A8UKD9_LEGHA|nr:hypothetical protein [Legionella hackeliae]KTD12849.1 hypothetical protein Lhac_1720 [Legionella hackeliae]CEK09153.1 protein of unknown function [Legionella hackeliae]STX49063.1 Uncharacterised protein [Legionella hackeliae]